MERADVIAEGNKIKGNAIPVSAPYRLRDCAFEAGTDAKVGSAFIGRFLESETDNAEEACRQFSEKHAANGENRCRSKVLLQENQVNDIRSTHPGKLFQ